MRSIIIKLYKAQVMSVVTNVLVQLAEISEPVSLSECIKIVEHWI